MRIICINILFICFLGIKLLAQKEKNVFNFKKHLNFNYSTILLSSKIINDCNSTFTQFRSTEDNKKFIFESACNDSCACKNVKEFLQNFKTALLKKDGQSCKLICDTINWIDWTSINKYKYYGISTDFGSLEINLDLRTGVIFPILNSLNLTNNQYFPKSIAKVPTPWMPGNINITQLIHQVNVEKVYSKKDLIFLVGNFPNEKKYNGIPQTGKLRILDRFGKKLNIADLCLVFIDAAGNASPMRITKLNNELLFNVDDVSNQDGEVAVFSNFPDSTYIIEVEHNNSVSYSQDGIYFTVGFPNCCKNDTIKIDTTVCEFFNFGGNKITQSGQYYLNISRTSCDSVIVMNATVLPKNPFMLARDTILCEGDILLLISNSDSTIWSDKSINKNLFVNKTGKYWGSYRTFCGIESDTIIVLFESPPKISLGQDRFICPNQKDTIWSSNLNSIWQDGSKGEYFIADKAGIYFATISNICGSASDTTEFNYFPKSNIDLGPDRIICDGSQYTLSSESDSTLWFDGTYSKFKTISKSGIYWGTVISKCGNVRDSLNLKVIPIISVQPLVKDTILCEGVNFNLNVLGISELWNNFYLDSIHVDHPGVYRYSYFDNCNNLSDSISVLYDSIPTPLKQKDITLCNYEELVLSIHNSNIIWSNGTVGSDIKISKAGSYSYLIENACGLFKDTIDVNVIEDQSTFIPNVFSPNGDNINDEFPGTQFTSDFNLKIYNRWGGLVFEAENQHWKGKFKDLDVNPGVYTYVIRTKFCNGKLKYGSVTLVR